MLGIRRMSRDRRRTEHGAVAVEFALILPLLAMLLLGIITFGLTYSNHLALTNTVREGARLGATAEDNGAWATSVVNRTVELYGDATNPLTSANVCALLLQKISTSTTDVLDASNGDCTTGGTPAGPPPATPTSIPDSGCFIKVWATVPAKLNWVFVQTDITLHAQSVAAYDRTQDCNGTP